MKSKGIQYNKMKSLAMGGTSFLSDVIAIPQELKVSPDLDALQRNYAASDQLEIQIGTFIPLLPQLVSG